MKLQLVSPNPTKRRIHFALLAVLLPVALFMSHRAQGQWNRFSEAQALYVEADRLMDQDRIAEAIPVLERSIELYSEMFVSWDALALCHDLLGDKQKAIAIMEESREHLQENPQYRALGVYYMEDKQYQKAVECFQKARELNPEEPIAPRLHERASAELARANGLQSSQAPVDGGKGGEHGQPDQNAQDGQ